MRIEYVLLVFCVYYCKAANRLEDVFEWKEMEYTFPSPQDRERMIANKDYIPKNNLPLGLARWNDKLFITMPRWKSGVAASLTYVPLNGSSKSPALIPYPNWEANLLPKEGEALKPDTIVSVFRVDIDACDRLWVMDTGLADILGDTKEYAKPSLAVFDLRTDKLIRRYEFKPTDLKESSFFANVVIDVDRNNCENAYAYVPDLGGYGVVVYSWKNNDSWRIKHHYFHFDPLNGEYNVGGVKFQWTDGVFGLALSKPNPDGYRTMHFHALSSTKEFMVSTEILRNQTLATDPHSFHYYKLSGEKGPMTQSSGSSMDQNSGVLFMTQVNKNAVACWKTSKPLNPQNLGIVAQDDEKLVFTNDLKLDRDEQLWILSDRMPEFLFQELNPNNINYRIMKMKVADAIANTPCA